MFGFLFLSIALPNSLHLSPEAILIDQRMTAIPTSHRMLRSYPPSSKMKALKHMSTAFRTEAQISELGGVIRSGMRQLSCLIGKPLERYSDLPFVPVILPLTRGANSEASRSKKPLHLRQGLSFEPKFSSLAILSLVCCPAQQDCLPDAGARFRSSMTFFRCLALYHRKMEFVRLCFE